MKNEYKRMQQLAGLITEIKVNNPSKLRAIINTMVNKIKYEKEGIGTYNTRTNVYYLDFDFIGTVWQGIFYKMYKHKHDEDNDDDSNKFNEIQQLTYELLLNKIRTKYNDNTSLKYEY